jgi:hypothetical protein
MMHEPLMLWLYLDRKGMYALDTEESLQALDHLLDL